MGKRDLQRIEVLTEVLPNAERLWSAARVLAVST
jgi:hypothetical protein